MELNKDKPVKVTFLLDATISQKLDDVSENLKLLIDSVSYVMGLEKAEKSKRKITEITLEKGLDLMEKELKEELGISLFNREEVATYIEGLSLEAMDVHLPSQQAYKDAIVNILIRKEGYKLNSGEMYKQLRSVFSLNSNQVKMTYGETKRNAHENKAQYAIRELKDDGTVSKNEIRGVWKLTDDYVSSIQDLDIWIKLPYIYDPSDYS